MIESDVKPFIVLKSAQISFALTESIFDLKSILLICKFGKSYTAGLAVTM